MPSDAALRWIKTSIVLFSMLNAGISLGIFSPSLPAMTILTSSTTAAMSTTLVWTGVSGMAGALLLGTLFDKYDGMGVLACATCLQGAMLSLAPWCPELLGYQLMAAATCFFNFGLTAGTIAVNCVIWKKLPSMIAPVVQVTDLIHALGTAIAPQIIAPFLTLKYKLGNGTFPNITMDTYVFEINATTMAPQQLELDGIQAVQVAYVLVGILSIISGVICLVMYFIGRDTDDSQLKSYEYAKNRMIRRRSYSLNVDGTSLLAYEEPPTRDRSDTGTLATAILRKNLGAGNRTETDVHDLRRMLQERRLNRQAERERSEGPSTSAHGHGGGGDSSIPPLSVNRRMISLLVIMLLFIMFNGGRDALMTGLLFTYFDSLGWSVTTGTLMVTLYHVTRVLVHVLVVVMAKWVSAYRLTLVNLVILVASSGLMLATVHASSFFLAIGVILTAFATSNLHPTAITLAQCSFQVTGKLIGIFYGALACGQIVFSPIAGALMQSAGPVAFPFLLLFISMGGSVLFIPWTLLARVVKRYYHEVRKPFEEIIITDRSSHERSPLVS